MKGFTMPKIELDLPDYLVNLLRAGSEAYERYFSDEAGAVFIEMVLAEYVCSRLSVLVDREKLLELQEKPEALFNFAAEYLRTKSIEFEQGKADTKWTSELEECND